MLQTRDVTGHIGTEVTGVALASANDSEITDLMGLVADRGVLFFRDQKMGLEEHVALGRRFGALHVHPAAASEPGYPEAMRIFTEPDATSIAGETWHSDVSCDEIPPALSILRLTQVPATGGDTLWASTYLAYETLSPPIKELASGMEALHSSANYYNRRYGVAPTGKEYPEAVHPVVTTHPITGRKALYVNPMFTASIVGLDALESDALLKLLFDHLAYGVEFHVRLRWEPHTVAIWDNRCTQHHATWDYFPHPRRGHRVTTRGERPVS